MSARPLATDSVEPDRAEPTLGHAPVTVLGVGVLGPDPQAIAERVVTVAKVQGIEHVETQVRWARSGLEQLEGLGERSQNPATVARARTGLARLEVAQAVLTALKEARANVRTELEPQVVAFAEQSLDATLGQVEALRKRYAGDRTQLESLRQDAQTLEKALRAMDQGALTLEDYGELYRELADRHPPLARFAPGMSSADRGYLWGLADPVDVEVIGGRAVERPRPGDAGLTRLLDDTASAARSLKAQLRDDPTRVWHLPDLVDASLKDLEIAPSCLVGALARDEARRTVADRAFTRKLTVTLAVGLGVAAAIPSGGASLAVAGGMALSVDAFDLFLSLEQYRLQRAGHRSALDAAEAASRRDASDALMALEVLAVGMAAIGTGLETARVLEIGPALRARRRGPAAARPELEYPPSMARTVGLSRTTGAADPAHWKRIEAGRARIGAERLQRLDDHLRLAELVPPSLQRRRDFLAEVLVERSEAVDVLQRMPPAGRNPAWRQEHAKAQGLMDQASVELARYDAFIGAHRATHAGEARSLVRDILRDLRAVRSEAEARALALQIPIERSAHRFRDRILEEATAYYRMVKDPVPPHQLRIFAQGERGYAVPGSNRVNIGDGHAGVVLHELGHVTEWRHPDVLAENRAWRDARGVEAHGRVRHGQMRDLDRRAKYSSNEPAVEDHFYTPYVGREYGAASTEVLSTGLEMLRDTTCTLDLYLLDPEHFLLLAGGLSR